MKRHFLVLSVFMILGLTSITSSSCKKKTDPVPDFPQLIGHWSGMTSQSAQVRFMIDNMKGYLYVMEYHITVYTAGGYHEYQAYYNYGIAAVSNKQFRIHLGTGSAGEAYIDGTFNINDMSLYGSFAVYEPGNTTDIITGNYTCNKDN